MSPSAGTATMPTTGSPSCTIARLTVYSLDPATNSLVPSRGSMSAKTSPSRDGQIAISSDTTATPGISLAIACNNMACERSSASVTGDRSALIRTLQAPAGVAAAAAATSAVSFDKRASSTIAVSTAGRPTLISSVPNACRYVHLGGAPAAVYQTLPSGASVD